MARIPETGAAQASRLSRAERRSAARDAAKRPVKGPEDFGPPGRKASPELVLLPLAVFAAFCALPRIYTHRELLLSFVGTALALVFRSRVVSAAILALLWTAQFLFEPVFLNNGLLQLVSLFLTEQVGMTSYWLTNRLILLGLALGLLCAALWLLGRNEWLLGAEA